MASPFSFPDGYSDPSKCPAWSNEEKKFYRFIYKDVDELVRSKEKEFPGLGFKRAFPDPKTVTRKLRKRKRLTPLSKSERRRLRANRKST